jgi:hypothetical protein
MRTAARATISLVAALLSGYWTFWGVLRHLAAPIEAEYGPDIFHEDATAGITMFGYMVTTAGPLALLVFTAVFVVMMIISGRYWPKFPTTQF